MAQATTAPTSVELNQADDLVFHILKRRAQAIAKASLIEPDAPLSATDLNVLKELRRSARDLRARLEAQASEHEPPAPAGAPTPNRKQRRAAAQSLHGAPAPRSAKIARQAHQARQA